MSDLSVMTHKVAPKVSVIIPIYNTAAYLPQALESICKQTLKELQIICIDDGSTDESPQIIKKRATLDERIQIISQKNQGQGAARNHGLSYATGEYIYFMDSDDVLATDCLETCYKLCETEDLDYVTFDAEVLIEDKYINKNFNYDRKYLIDSTKLWNSKELMNYTLNNDSFKSTAWLYFIRRDVIELNKINFASGIIHEDNLFVVHLALCSSKVRYLARPFFKRRIRQNSTMTTQFCMRNIIGYLTIAEKLQILKSINSDWIPLIELFLHKTLNSVVWLSHSLKWKEKIKTFHLFKKHHLLHYASVRNWLVFWIK